MIWIMLTYLMIGVALLIWGVLKEDLVSRAMMIFLAACFFLCLIPQYRSLRDVISKEAILEYNIQRMIEEGEMVWTVNPKTGETKLITVEESE